MKWETIKRRVADEVASAVEQGRHAPEEILADLVASNFEVLRQLPDGNKWHGPIRTAYAAQVRKRIEDWDIRAVGRLRDLFNAAFPPSLRKCPLIAEYDENGDWVILPNAQGEAPARKTPI